MAMGADAINYMQELLDDLLACARLEAGVELLEKEPVSIKEVIEPVLGRLKFQIEEKNVTVTVDTDAVLLADRKALTKIFMNLIGNAINYIGDGEKRAIKIGSQDKNPETVFYISDNGLGIPADSQPALFQKFKRGGNVSGISGTGLGLAIVKGMVEAHGGRIWFQSREGHGTTFYFTLTNSPKGSAA
jgi:signal transduction histidine kinase